MSLELTRVELCDGCTRYVRRIVNILNQRACVIHAVKTKVQNFIN